MSHSGLVHHVGNVAGGNLSRVRISPFPQKRCYNKNMTKIWFKRKRYGYGWTPNTWQGWLIIFDFTGIIYLNFIRIDSMSHSSSDTLINFLPQTFLLGIILFFICYKKGEKPRWSWGKD